VHPRWINRLSAKLVALVLTVKARASTDHPVAVSMSAAMAELFIDLLKNTDPDMARAWRQLMPQPLVPMLGPIVGDQRMNEKLRRLDELADKPGPTAILLTGLAGQLERALEKRMQR